MTDVSSSYDRWVRRQTSMLCIDGQHRSDCVIVVEIGRRGGADDELLEDIAERVAQVGH